MPSPSRRSWDGEAVSVRIVFVAAALFWAGSFSFMNKINPLPKDSLLARLRLGHWRRWRSRLRKFCIVHRRVCVDLRPLVGTVSFRAHNANGERNFESANFAVVLVRSLLGERAENALHGRIGTRQEAGLRIEI